MRTIEHEAANKDLANETTAHNAAVERAQETARGLSEPISLDDGELLKIDQQGLELQRAARVSELLQHRQDAARIARHRVEILEQIQPELDDRATDAQKEFEAVTNRTRKAMEKATGGEANTQAGRLGNELYAARQFGSMVRQAAPCREAEAALKAASHRRDANRKDAQRSKEAVITAVAALQTFVGTQINEKEVSYSSSSSLAFSDIGPVTAGTFLRQSGSFLGSRQRNPAPPRLFARKSIL